MKENNYDLTSIIAPASFAAAEYSNTNSPSYSNTENALNLVANETSYATITFSSTSQFAYYTFNTNFIPSNATIISVSASLRARTSNASRAINVLLGYFNADFGTSGRQYYTVGSSVAINTTSASVYNIDSASSGSWDPTKLSRINLRFKPLVSNSTSLYFYGCSLTIHYLYEETVYEITSTNYSPLIGEIYPDGLTEIYPLDHLSPYTLTLVGDSINNIIVTDANYETGYITDVTNQLQEHVSNIGYTNASFISTEATLVGTAYLDSLGYPNTSIWYNPVGHSAENPVTQTYNLFRRSSLSYNSYVDYKFDFSSILFTADIPDKTILMNDTSIIISDVSVVVYGKAENDTAVNLQYWIANVRLYSGDVAKSEALDLKPSYLKHYFEFPGKWTIQELQDAYLRFTFGVSGGHVGGITWHVNYIIEPDYPRYWTYTLARGNQDHDIVVNDNYTGVSYTVNTVVYYKSRVSVSNTHMVLRPGSQFNITIYTDDFEHVRILETYNDENIDMTDSGYVSRMPYANNSSRYKENTYIYTIPNIDRDHSIKIVEMKHYSVTVQSLIDNVTITTSNSKVYDGDDCTITVYTDSLSNIIIQDNDVDNTSIFTKTGDTFVGVLHNVHEDHDIVVVEDSKLILLSLSNSEDIRISPRGYNSILTGSSQEFIITTGPLTMMMNGRPSMFMQPKRTVSFLNIILKDNGVDKTELLTTIGENTYSYVLDNISEQHTVIVYELLVPEYEDPEYNYYSLSISSLEAVTLPTTGTVRVVEGTDYTVTIQPTKPNIIVLTDNDEDISDSSLFLKTYLPDIYVEADPSYTVTDRTPTYKFIKNENTGYYTSNNNSILNSQVVARVTFVLPVSCNVEIGYINYAEPNADYALFGNIDSALNAGDTAVVDLNVYYSCAPEIDHLAYEQSLIYEIPRGEHFIDIKYQKNANATHKNNDTLQFRIKNILALEPYVLYTYTVENVHEDHSLVFVFGDTAYYTVNTSGTNSRLYPYGTMIKLPELSYNLTIIPNVALYKIILTDNGYDKSANINKLEATIADLEVVNYIYSINRVNDNHVIEVICKNPYELFLKRNNIWGSVSKVYKKVNDEWVLIYDYTSEFLQDPTVIRMFKETVDNGR